MTSKMTMQKIIPKNEYANRQHYKQITTTTTNNHHRYAKYRDSER